MHSSSTMYKKEKTFVVYKTIKKFFLIFYSFTIHCLYCRAVVTFVLGQVVLLDLRGCEFPKNHLSQKFCLRKQF